MLADSQALSRGLEERIQALTDELETTNQKLASTDNDIKRSALQFRATSLTSQISALQQQAAELALPEDLRVGEMLNDPVGPRTPSSPVLPKNLALGGVLGLLLGAAAALLRDRWDRRVRDRSEIEVITQTAVLGVIPKDRKRAKIDPTRLVVSDPASPASEAYKMLRAALLVSPKVGDAKTLMTTSPNPGEGKTTVMANLGVALAQAGKRVILVSGDLRKPWIESLFGIQSPRGLSDALQGKIDPWECLVPLRHKNLVLLPSGPIPDNPSELFASQAAPDVLRELSQAADFVLVDTPPVLVTADAQTLSSLVDGVLVVVAAGSTTRPAIMQTSAILEQANARVLGWVLNKFDPRAHAGHTYAPGYYYQYVVHEGPGVAVSKEVRP